MNVAQGIAQYLAAQSIGITYSESAGGNAFIDDLPAVSQSAGVTVAVFHVGGSEADSGNAQDIPALQVVVRGTTDPRTSLDMWSAIYSHLHGLTNTTLPNGVYLIYCLAIQSAPVRMGPDENGRHRYSMNLRCEVENVTEHRS